jgi:hypothetical protein
MSEMPGDFYRLLKQSVTPPKSNKIIQSEYKCLIRHRENTMAETLAAQQNPDQSRVGLLKQTVQRVCYWLAVD